jgi:hypothetical protein
MPADRNTRERAGHLLAARRAQLSPRYANRRVFAAERGMNWRTLHDIEHAKRDNFRPETLRAFETAYALVPCSLDRTLAGGDLEPLPAGQELPPLRPVAAVPGPPSADEIPRPGSEAGDLDHLMRLYIARFDADTRRMLARLWALDMTAAERIELIEAWVRYRPPGFSEGRETG